jgi:hypothetical protein
VTKASSEVRAEELDVAPSVDPPYAGRGRGEGDITTRARVVDTPEGDGLAWVAGRLRWEHRLDHLRSAMPVDEF